MSIHRTARAEKARETAEALISVARRAFADQGFATVSLDALAQEAGVTRGALHHHFGNRAGLFEAVVHKIDRELEEGWTEAIAPHPDRWDAFRAGSHRYLSDMLDPGRRRILFQEAPAVLGLRGFEILMGTGFGDMVETLASQMRAGRIVALDPAALGHMLNGAVMQLAIWAAAAPPGEDRRGAAHAGLEAFFEGITIGHTPPPPGG